MKGSQWWHDKVPEDLGPEYAREVLRALAAGHGLVNWVKVEHESLTFDIACQPLAIGEPDDFVYLFGLSAWLVDQITEQQGWFQPTSAMLDWRAAVAGAVAVGPNPQPNGARGMRKAAASEHNLAVKATPAETTDVLVGACKTYVPNPRYRKGFACEYGWEVVKGNKWWNKVRPVANATRSGFVVQSEQWAHLYRDFHDYSMGFYPCAPIGTIDGAMANLAEALCDPTLGSHLSVYGAHPWARHPEAAGEPATQNNTRPTLRLGDRGPGVERWQALLVQYGLSLAPFGVDGDFGRLTQERTKSLQYKLGAKPDGIVGPDTWKRAEQTEQTTILDVTAGARRNPLSEVERRALWGSFDFEPIADSDDIRIKGSWVRDNIVSVEVPQLVGVYGVPRNGKILWHRKGVDALLALFEAWEEKGLMPHVLTWAGSWVPRFVRGSRTTLSNHAYGSAFDVNAQWNPLGATPASKGERGSVLDLVTIAQQYGFFWGGHYRQRPDGMHFELCSI